MKKVNDWYKVTDRTSFYYNMVGKEVDVPIEGDLLSLVKRLWFGDSIGTSMFWNGQIEYEESY